MGERSNRHAAATGTESRPLNIRIRPDLRCRLVVGGLGCSWVVKDPLAMNYVELRKEEYEVLRMLDGRASLRDVKQRLEEECFPARVSLFDVQQFLAKLRRANLVVVDAFGQDQPLLEGQRQAQRSEWFSRWSNPLALRFPGINPAPLLDRLYPLVRWAFSPAAFAVGLFLIFAALLLVVVQFDALVADLPALAEFFALQNVLLLAVMLVLVKGLHELAHALTCKHLGGSCHEIGVMLLAFTPCFYCNVSDAWMFPNKWHRIAVSVAGICAELVIAAVCTLLWWFSEPGLLHWACLDAMFLCCVSTLLINGNPLLKYDGYYALADWLGVSNLRQQSGQIVEQFTTRLLSGVDAYPDRLLQRSGRWFLALYWIASVVYRWFVVAVILWSVHELMKARHLESIANVLAVFVVAGIVIGSGWSLAGMIRRVRTRGGNQVRATLIATGAFALLVVILLVPLPARVRAPAVFWPANAHLVFVTVPGTLADHLEVGERVQQSEPIARLVNLELEREVHKLAGQLKLQQIHVRHLELRRTSDPAAGNELPTAREMLVDFDAQYRERESDLQRLTIPAPIDGVVLHPTIVKPDLTQAGQLGDWRGNPLEPRNEGAFLETGTLLCYVGDLQQLESLLIIDETTRHRVRRGQSVRIWVGTDSFRGTIVEVARRDLMSGDDERAGRADSVLLELAGASDAPGSVYYARVELDDREPGLCGVGGTAKITTPARSLAQRMIDYVSHTFRFRL